MNSKDTINFNDTTVKISYQALVHDMINNDLKSIAWTSLEEEKLIQNRFGLQNYYYENMEEDYILIHISFDIRTDNMLLLTSMPNKNKEIIDILNKCETFTIDPNLLNFKTKKINESHPDNLYNMSFIITIDNNHADLTEIQKTQLFTFYKNAIINNNLTYPPIEEAACNNIINNIEIKFIPNDYRIFTIQLELEFNKILSIDMVYQFIETYFNWVSLDIFTKLSNLLLVPDSYLIEDYYHT